jgi:hypothetical protein
MESSGARRNAGLVLPALGAIGFVLAAGPMPSGAAMAAHPALRTHVQITAALRLVSSGLLVGGGLVVCLSLFSR